jgi:hypothetical protein
VNAYLGGEAQQQQPPTVDFQPKHSDATFRFAGLSGTQGEPTTSFTPSEPILLRCCFKSRRRILGLQLSFSVFNFKGDQVFYSTTSMAEPAISVETAGEHKITAMIPGRLLLPGNYSITLALHTPKTKLYDLRRHALGFKIVATMDDRFDGFASDELGYVYADVKWRTDDTLAPASVREAALS